MTESGIRYRGGRHVIDNILSANVVGRVRYSEEKKKMRRGRVLKCHDAAFSHTSHFLTLP